MEKDSTYKRHILDAIAGITEYVGQMNHEEFLADNKTQDAVVRKLEIIGEAAKRLSIEFKNKTASVPWRQITGTRDKITHDYMSIDLEFVWTIIKDDLPALKSALK